MACAEGALLGRLKALVQDIEGNNYCPPPSNQGFVAIQPTTEPCATCCMVCPPPILAPTSPSPVKPLRLPCPTDNDQQPQLSDAEADRTRYANFYNNYNVDWHDAGVDGRADAVADPRRNKCAGVTTDGKSPCCEDYVLKSKRRAVRDQGCPTGFKPCSMKLTPPAGCHPCGVWSAEVQPCPPKNKKKSNNYEPGPCTRPCCKHWKPKDGDCKYDDPCKAQCVNHPPGMKPTKHSL